MFKYGTNAADVIFGSDESDAFWGRGGNDALYLGLGDDTGEGGHGSDFIDGNVGDDFLRGGYGNDVLLGGPGNDNLNGNENEDVLIGGPGRDKLNGGHGSDYLNGHGLLFGNNGADYLTTDLLWDVDSVMIGGNGPDTFVATSHFDGNTTAAEVNDFGPADKFAITVDLSGLGIDYTFTARQVFQTLDTNADHVLNGTDPESWLGSTWINVLGSDSRDDVPDDLIINVADDVVTFHGIQALTDGQLYG